MRAQKLVCGLLAVALLAGGCKRKDRYLTTDLHGAAERGDLAEVQRIIAHGANLNARDSMGRTPLHEAAKGGYQEVVDVLVRCGARIDCEDRDGLTPAMLAMRWGHPVVVTSLVQAGATVNLHLAVYLGDADRVASLIQGGADPNAVGEEEDWTPLHYAANYNREEIGDLLMSAGAEINARDKRGRTPLHLATEKGYAGVVELLLLHGAEINTKGEYGNTPLHVADVNTARLLVAAGADLEVRNEQGETPLYCAADFGQTALVELLIAGGANADGRMVRGTLSRSPLEIAIENGRIDVVRLLVPKVKDINVDSPLNTAITSTFSGASARFAQEYPDPDATYEDREAAVEREMHKLRITLVELLLAYGADVNGRNEDGWTALHCAASEGLRDIAELLLRRGANVHPRAVQRYWLPNDPISVHRQFAGITPLHNAAVSGGPGVVELLIAHGAEVDARTESGKTPLHYAASHRYARGHEVSPRRWHYRDRWRQCDVVKLLIAKGAGVNASDIDGATPLHYALQSGQREIAEALIAAGAEIVAVKNEGDQTMLHDALQQKDFALIGLLLANGADTEERDEDGNTLLHLAARDRNQELLALLIADHADVNARNRGAITPLCYAASGGAVALVTLLLANGAEVNAQDNQGDTALHGAALHGHKEVAQLLLAHGADINARNTRGRMPLDEANRRGHADIVQLLTAKTAGTKTGVQEGGAKK